MAFCLYCGAESSEGAAYCPVCGAKAPASSALAVVGNATHFTDPSFDGSFASSETLAQPASMSSASAPNAHSPKRRKRTAAIVVALLLVVAAIVSIGIAVWWNHAQEEARQQEDARQQEAWEWAHTSVVTLINLDAPGFDGESTSIPVRVTGTDLDGSAVIEVQYLRPNSPCIKTLPGDYEVSVCCGYLAKGGRVFRKPAATIRVIAAREGSPEEPASQPDDVLPLSEGPGSPADPLKFTEVPVAEVTDEELEEIVSLAQEDPEDDGKAEGLREDAVQKRDEAAEEQRRAEEEERAAARASTACAFGLQYFTNIEIPEGADDVAVFNSGDIRIQDWESRVRAYLAPGSAAMSRFDANSSPFWTDDPRGVAGLGGASIALSADVISDDGTTITVSVVYAFTQNPSPGWSKEPKYIARLVCTMAEDNLVTSYQGYNSPL